MGKFGYSYPPGAAGDPSAPYNQEETPDNCIVENVFTPFADGPHAAYLKLRDLGISLGVTLQYMHQEPTIDPDRCHEYMVTETYWNDDLKQWGTWRDLEHEHGAYVTDVRVGIGVRALAHDFLETDGNKFIKDFWGAVRLMQDHAQFVVGKRWAHRYVVTATALVDESALHWDDHEVDDVYDFTAFSEEHALDLFHETVPIKMLEDFEISVSRVP